MTSWRNGIIYLLSRKIQIIIRRQSDEQMSTLKLLTALLIIHHSKQMHN